MKTTKRSEPRNWALVILSSIIFLLGLTLLVLSIVFASTFGWVSLAIGLGGFASMGAAVMSIITNDPSWILLDLIIPG